MNVEDGGALFGGSSQRSGGLTAARSDWRWCSLSDCVDLVSGFAFKSERFSEKAAGGIALVKGENVSQGRILWSISKYWPEAEWADYERVQLRSGDVVVAMDRPWVPAGLKWAFVSDKDPRALLVQRCARLRTKTDSLDQGFLRFVIGSPEFENYIKPIVTGVNVPHISGAQILAHRFMLPPLVHQRRIAGILSAYDELIENCELRIRVLDEMARALYREWFVLFRYPGHEKTPHVDSALGRIPRDWEVVTLDDVCSRITDGAHASPKTVDAGLPMASSKDMHDWGLDLSTARHISPADFDLLVRAGCQPHEGDVLVTKDGANYLKRIFVLRDEPKAVLLSSIAILRAGGMMSPSLLAAGLRAPDTRGRLKNYVTGAAIPRIVLKDFKAFQIVLPPERIRTLWEQFGEPYDVACWQLSTRVENLRRTRDLLLPRLLSGQLAVEAAA